MGQIVTSRNGTEFDTYGHDRTEKDDVGPSDSELSVMEILDSKEGAETVYYGVAVGVIFVKVHKDDSPHDVLRTADGIGLDIFDISPLPHSTTYMFKDNR